MNGEICPWALRTPLERVYHDEQWGRPLHDDARLFELLVLEFMQAGLSWSTILSKREHMRAAFDGFDAEAISLYGEEKINALLEDAGIIRNRLKLKALVGNARAFIRVQLDFGSFDAYLWGFLEDGPFDGKREKIQDVPAKTPLAERIAKDMKKRGFSFMGPTIVYAFMQAAGLVNDHLISCPVYTQAKEEQG